MFHQPTNITIRKENDFLLTKPVTNQHIKNKAVPPTLLEVCEHVNETSLQKLDNFIKLARFRAPKVVTFICTKL